jgi:hypothetical protein
VKIEALTDSKAQVEQDLVKFGVQIEDPIDAPEPEAPPSPALEYFFHSSSSLSNSIQFNSIVQLTTLSDTVVSAFQSD